MPSLLCISRAARAISSTLPQLLRLISEIISAARTAWHIHSLDQTLLVIVAQGAQRGGGPIETNQPGDVIWFEPDAKPWHGAARDTAMTHVAIAIAIAKQQQHDRGSWTGSIMSAMHSTVAMPAACLDD